MSKSYNQPCPIASALDVLGERWTLLIVRELLEGRSRFSELELQLPGVAPNLLSSRLRKLEEHGIVERRLVEDRPPRYEYVLTEAGKELWIPLRAIGLWGTRHVQRRFKRVHEWCGGEVDLEIYCENCDEIIEDEETRMMRRKGR